MKKICAALLLFFLNGCMAEENTAAVEPLTTETDAPAVSSDVTIEGWNTYTDYTPEKQTADPLIDNASDDSLIVYFSRSKNTVFQGNADTETGASIRYDADGNIVGNTEIIAGWIADETGADISAIQTEYSYPQNYDQLVAVGEGQDKDGYHPRLASYIDNISDYKNVWLVYPTWHYTLPAPVCSFLEQYDLSGKSIYVVNVNLGSAFAGYETIAEYQPDAYVEQVISINGRDVPEAEEEVREKVKEIENE